MSFVTAASVVKSIPIEYNGTLILDGLYSIWKRNVKK